MRRLTRGWMDSTHIYAIMEFKKFFRGVITHELMRSHHSHVPCSALFTVGALRARHSEDIGGDV